MQEVAKINLGDKVSNNDEVINYKSAAIGCQKTSDCWLSRDVHSLA